MQTTTRISVSALSLSLCAGAACAQSFYEPFDQTTGIPAGWTAKHQSEPSGGVEWNIQNNAPVFPAHTNPSIASSNYNSTTGVGTISDWLIPPAVTLRNGDTISFYTRSASGTEGGPYGDRMQLRMSTAGASTNTGTTSTSVGDFTTLLVDINPTYIPTGYPHGVWQQFTANVSGLGAPTQGRFAFRYFVEGGGPAGANSNYIGLDTVDYTSAIAAPGACCQLDGSCQLLSHVACYNAGGTFQGDGVACGACPQPGACCLPDGTCQQMAGVTCNATHGAIYKGDNTSCPSTCLQTGACCLLDNTCAIQTEAQCRGNNGLFRGVGSACAGAGCPTAFAYVGSPVFIQDATGQGGTFCGAEAVAEVTVPSAFTVGAVDVSMFITHEWQGDLVFTLTHVPTNTSVEFYNRVPFGSGGSYDANNFGASPANGDLFRSIDTAQNFYRTPPAPGGGIPNVRGQWKPDVPFTPFAGINGQGVWRLRVRDCGGPGDIGNIETWTLSLHVPGQAACYANCDNSTQAPVLNVQDFSCFLTRYAAGESYANCDSSTQQPVLNVQDFSCFLTKYAAGCP